MNSLIEFIKLAENEETLEKLLGFQLFLQQYDFAIREVRTKLDILNAEFKIYHGHNPIHHIESRLKSPGSVAKKLERYGVDVSLDSAKENLMDIAGVRVVCRYIEDVYYVEKLLSQQDDLEVVKKKDYIANPKPNGYRSLHLIVKVPVFLTSRTESVPVEIQIRTVGMDFWAALEHEIRYKTKGTVPEHLNAELQKCAELSAHLDEKMQEIYQNCSEEEKN